MKPAKFQIVKFDPGAAKFIGFAKQQCQRLIDNGTEDFYRFWNMGGGITIKAKSYCGSVKLWLEASLGSRLIGPANIYPSGAQLEYYYPTTTAKYDSVAANIALTETTVSKSLTFNNLPWWLGMPSEIGSCYGWLSNALYGADYVLNPATGHYDITVSLVSIKDSSKIITYTLPESIVYGTVDPASPGANINISVDFLLVAGRPTAIITPDGISTVFGPPTPILWDVKSGVLRLSPELLGEVPLNPFISNQTGTVTASYGWLFSSDVLAFRFNVTTSLFDVVQHTPPSAFLSAAHIDTNICKGAVNFRFYASTTSGIGYYQITDAQLASSSAISLSDATAFFSAGLTAYGIANSISTPSIATIQPASAVFSGYNSAVPASISTTGFFDVLYCTLSDGVGRILLGITQSGYFDLGNFNASGVSNISSTGTASEFGVADGYWYGTFNISSAYYEGRVYDHTFNLLASVADYSANFATAIGIYFLRNSGSGTAAKIYAFGSASVLSLAVVSAPSGVIATPDVDIIVCPSGGTYTIYGYYPDGTLVTLGTSTLPSNVGINRFCYYHAESRRLFIENTAVIVDVGKKASMALVTNIDFLPVTLGSPPSFSYFAYLPTYYPAQSDWGTEWVAQTAALQPP